MEYSNNIKQKSIIDYSTFLDQLEQNLIESITISRYKASGAYKNGAQFETRLPKKYDSELETLLRKHNVKISSLPFFGFGKMFLLISAILFLLSFFYLAHKSTAIATSSITKDSLGNFSKNKAKLYLPGQIKTNFNSVAGAYEAKEDLQDVVDFLKNPDKYKKIGAKLTRGVLLVGEPGNGKTLLAKAVAGEANCPFFYISGSDFLELFVGVGAARIRDLFAQARQLAPCIVFIDEIDAVGRQRDRGFSISHDEREQTLNQLLTEMDGFETADTSVIVLAATNRPDVLDKALLRPGRFDRKVHVPYPDLKSREEVLKVHVKDVKIDNNINLKSIASGTPGFTGADLANLVNLAAITAAKNSSQNETPKVKVEHFEEARDVMLLGKERKTITLTKKEMEVTAYHEAGHALVNLLIPEYLDPLYKVTIIPRGETLGVTHSMPEREKHSVCREEMEAQVICALGGRAAEEIIFNKLETGAASDFKKATQIVRQMICYYGMSKELGTVVYEHKPGELNCAEATLQKIDEETKKITVECYEKALKLIKENRSKLEQLAQELLKKETLFASEIYKLLKITPRETHNFGTKELGLTN